MRLARDWGEKEVMDGLEASRSALSIKGRSSEEEEMMSFIFAMATAMETSPWLSNSENRGLAMAISTQKDLLISNEVEEERLLLLRDGEEVLERLERAAVRQIVSTLVQSDAFVGRKVRSSVHVLACFIRVVLLLQSVGEGPNRPCSSKSRSD